jgi:hypothetical protein
VDPGTGEFTRLTAPDAFPGGKYPFVFTVDAGSDQMFLAIGSNFADGVGCNFHVYSVDLDTGAVNPHSELHSVSGRYLYYSRARYLPGSGQLMISGGCTVLGPSTNSNPSAATYFVETDPLPAVVVNVYSAGNHSVELRFVAHAGFTYQCQYTESLSPANWQTVPDEADIEGAGEEHSVFRSFEGRPTPHEFLRVTIVP